GNRLIGIQVTTGLTLEYIGAQLENTSEKLLALFWIFLLGGNILAPFYSCSIIESRIGRECALIPTSASTNAGAHDAGLAKLRLIATDEVALCIHTLDPINVIHHRPSGNKISGGTVDHEHVAALIYVQKQLSRRSVHWQVEQHAFIGGIPVPNVMRNLLKMPLQPSGVHVQRNNTI